MPHMVLWDLRRGPVAALAALVALALVLSSCLKPDEFDPTGNEPIGRLELVEAAGTAIRVKGWAIDPNTASSVAVTVAFVGRNVKVTANLPRPDVASRHRGFGLNHGFDFTTPSLGVAVGQVCVWIENVGPGSRGRLLGCQDVRLRSDNSIGAFESATALSLRSVRISGWGLDEETPSLPVNISWKLNDGPWQYHPANLPRADVNWAVGVAGNHGFSFDIVVPPGSNRVCVRVPAYGRGAAQDLGCKTVLNESVSPLGPGLDLLGVQRVKPPPGHVLEVMSRDAGVSTRLGDGSVMWFFGDTSDFNSDGSLKFLVNNTAAWSPSNDPARTTDAVDGRRLPVLSMAPVEPFKTPCPASWKSVLWPAAAVTVPGTGANDRVFVYFGNICLGGEMKFESRGMGLAEFTYDRSSPPDGVPLTGQIVTQSLFGNDLRHGTAAMYDDGFIYAYQCRTPRGDGTVHWPNDPMYGPCTVARVAPDTAGDVSSYSYWTGNGDWVADPAEAEGMDLPGAVPDPGADKMLPPAAFTVVKDPHHGYLMVYTSWPGLSNWVSVRRAPTPVGPWSSVQQYELPGCDDFGGNRGRYCYAATAQPAFSSPTSIGIGYFDELTSLSPARGAYLAGTVASRW